MSNNLSWIEVMKRDIDRRERSHKFKLFLINLVHYSSVVGIGFVLGFLFAKVI